MRSLLKLARGSGNGEKRPAKILGAMGIGKRRIDANRNGQPGFSPGRLLRGVDPGAPPPSITLIKSFCIRTLHERSPRNRPRYRVKRLKVLRSPLNTVSGE